MKSLLLAFLSLYTIPLHATPITTPPPNFRPLFLLHNLTYTSSIVYSTPAHLAVADGEISFNVSNTVSPVPCTVSCHATGQQLWDFFYGDIVYPCTLPISAIAWDLGPRVETNFTFSRQDGMVYVNQTWLGDGERFSGTGNAKANLNCSTTNWQNSNWTLGQLYSIQSTTCQPLDLWMEEEVEQVLISG